MTTEFTKEHCVGCVVQSAAGRDKNRFFIITGLCTDGSDGMVYIADGRLRHVESPKKKKLSHLRFIATEDSGIASLIDGGRLTNRIAWNHVGKYDPARSCKG